MKTGPGLSYLDSGSGGPENDFTNRNTTFMTWNLMHLARILDAGGIPALRLTVGPGRYETVVRIGDLDGRAELTFTCPWRTDEVLHVPPSAAYLACSRAA